MNDIRSPYTGLIIHIIENNTHMFRTRTTPSSRERGFTLIELLVVIAIIGILSSVVLASLNSAREGSRDARRISDIKQLQLALELYFDDNGSYPNAISSSNLVDPGYIPTIPTDPSDDSAYGFDINSGGTDYCLGASLENSNSIPDAHVSNCVDGSGDPDIGSSYNYAIKP